MITEGLKFDRNKVRYRTRITYHRVGCRWPCFYPTSYVLQVEIVLSSKKTGKRLAALLLCPAGLGLETHSKIYHRGFLNKGMGLYLYSLAADWCAKKQVILKSSRTPSLAARRLWKSKRLRQQYNVVWIPNEKCWYLNPRK